MRASVLMAGAGYRLLIVALLLGMLWAGIFWALD